LRTQPVLESREWQHVRHAVSATLLACGDNDFLQMAYTFFPTFTAEPHDALLGNERLNSGYAQFDCFLHDPVHLFTHTHRLSKQNGERGFALDLYMPFDYNSHTLLADSRNDRREFSTVAIEQHHFIAWLESQNACGMMRNC
jgi:hypothetical protein